MSSIYFLKTLLTLDKGVVVSPIKLNNWFIFSWALLSTSLNLFDEEFIILKLLA